MNKSIEQVFKGINKDIKFAFVASVTASAKKVQEAIIERTEDRYTIRKTWLRKGKYAVKVKAATKAKPIARVWNDAPWMVEHEPGATRTPANKYFAIPTANVKRNKSALISKASMPINIKNSFVDSIDGDKYIIKRVSKKKIKPMYLLAKKAKIKPKWWFKRTGLRTYLRVFDKELVKSMRKYVK
jgi:hypothetical protein